MKIIYPNNIVSVSADEENANYPVTNVQTDYTKEVWKATSYDAELTLVVSTGKGAALFNCNATSATVTILAGIDGVWGTTISGHVGAEWGTTISGHIGADWGESSYYSTYIYDSLETGLGALWCDYNELLVQHTIKIDLVTDTDKIVEVGIASAGEIESFQDPLYGINEGLKDYSIVKELSNGSYYIKKRDVVRTFSFNLLEDRDIDFYTFMHKIFLLRGSQPLAWRICTEKNTDWVWIVYCRMEQMPSGVHNYPDFSGITISLVEVI